MALTEQDISSSNVSDMYYSGMAAKKLGWDTD
jgi:hypothetical protein